MKATTVWFTEGYSNLYHAMNDIKKADVSGEFKILSSHSKGHFIGSAASDWFITEPKFTTDDAFIEFCLETAKSFNVDIIFASRKQKVLSKFKHLFDAINCKVVVCVDHLEYDSIDNKGLLYDRLSAIPDLSVNIPAYQVVQDKDSFKAAYTAMSDKGMTTCIKPTVGVYGEGFKIIDSNDQAVLIRPLFSQDDYLSVIQQKDRPIILMEYLDGFERSVDCVAVNGEFIGGTIRKKFTSSKPQLMECNPDVLDQAKWLTKALNLNGMFNIQFREHQGKNYLLEINTRLSGRSFYATLVGFNIPYIAACAFSGKPIPEFTIECDKYIANISSGVVLPSNEFNFE